MKPLIVIPSRLASTRLANKALVDILGKPMIVHVYERAKKANLADVIVACCCEEIARPLREIGAPVFITPADLPSGTDRIYHALESYDVQKKYDVIINLQGDLPTVTKECLQGILEPFKDPSIDISTLVVPITDEKELSDPNICKAAVSNKKALYFSRAAIKSEGNKYYHHVGVYGYKRDSLKKFVSLPSSPLEISEKLEQLRALEAGMTIGVFELSSVPHSVDTQKDLEKVKRFLKEETTF
ncbi:MAG TPA: 3-deoxy-manno-octulosonate cytidylyltransferase [Alphaproteobacteria bacterium]|nr:3-deoxy-manno-octulosonate cytidylyltransferase [Alphaproteobacteria bacterium]